MVGLAKQTAPKPFQTSTSEVYSDPVVLPRIEDHLGNVNPIDSCSDEGKHCAESLFFKYRGQH